ncbi:hypothetical protein B4U80_13336 [Leptotrombidium deliense]|uniref:Uncharacterized protein n=1 Tax=Leptotrombidium deliense TaxID=299467 RepID=A0A443S7Z1_9ACAR|nr:hypothetical protein B4U80_13336 [Leptotrombidium deliense]
MNRLFFELNEESSALKVSSWKEVDFFLRACGKMESVEFFDCLFEDNWRLNQIAEKIASVITLRFYFFMDLFVSHTSTNEMNLQNLISKTSVVKHFTLIFDNSGRLDERRSKMNLITDEILMRNSHIQTLQLRADNMKFNCALLPALREFNVRLSEGFILPENALSQLLSTSKNTLEMLRYPIMTKEDFEIMTQFTKITDLRLVIYNMNNDGFRRLKFENLLQLQLKIWESDAGVNVDGESVMSVIYRNKHLKVLHLRLPSWKNGDAQVNISNISDNCKELEYVALHPFVAFELCLQSLSTLPKLEYLELGGCYSLKDDSMADFVNQSPLLRGIALYESPEEKYITLESMKIKAHNNQSKYYFARLPVPQALEDGAPENLKVKVEDCNLWNTAVRRWNHFFLVDDNSVYNDDFLAWKQNAEHFLDSIYIDLNDELYFG